MIALAKSPSQQTPIHLTDTGFETSQIVETAMNIIYTLEFNYESSDFGLDDFQFLTDFAKKWEISMIDIVIKKDQLRDVNSKSGPTWPFDNFLIALKSGNNELAARYFTYYERQIREHKPSKGRSDRYRRDLFEKGFSLRHWLKDISLDRNNILGMMSHGDFLHIPQSVVWVILRAQSLEGATGALDKDIMRQLLDLVGMCRGVSHSNSRAS